jgi:cephalosporin hydroxylase
MSISESEKFISERGLALAQSKENEELKSATSAFMLESIQSRYSYNFDWLGRPIIQYPADIVAMQEIIWQVKPDLIIETGVAHGGSIVLSASMLALLDLCDALAAGDTSGVNKPKRQVIGIDIDIRRHNREAIEAHPLFPWVQLIQGSSTDANIVEQVCGLARNKQKVLVCLDSNHTHAHVLEELKAYAPLVSPGSYCVVFDTIVEDLPKSLYPDRPWGPGDNPLTAVEEFISSNSDFENDQDIETRLQITVARGGFLRRKST